MNNNIIGTIGAEKVLENVWRLKELYVQKNYRGRGVGQKLLEAIIWKLDHLHHARVIELKVNTRQEVAINLYKKCGFTIASTLENQESGDGKRYTKFIMCRNQCMLHIQQFHTSANAYG